MKPCAAPSRPSCKGAALAPKPKSYFMRRTVTLAGPTGCASDHLLLQQAIDGSAAWLEMTMTATPKMLLAVRFGQPINMQPSCWLARLGPTVVFALLFGFTEARARHRRRHHGVRSRWKRRGRQWSIRVSGTLHS